MCKNRKGIQIKETVSRTEGCANEKWLNDNSLDMFSTPEKWIEALLPDKRLPTDPKHTVKIIDWCSYTNSKAMMMNAGKKGGMYPEFEPFLPTEIKLFIGLYLLNGLSPSPQLNLNLSLR